MSGGITKDDYARRYNYDEQQPTMAKRLSKKLGVESQNSANGPEDNGVGGIRLSGKTLTPVKNPIDNLPSFDFNNNKSAVEDYDREFEENMNAIQKTQQTL